MLIVKYQKGKLMHYRVLEDVIDQKIIDGILHVYENNKERRVVENYMDKLNFPWKYKEVREIENYIKDYVDVSTYIGDNIYKHQYPYFPHVDLSVEYPCVNVLIPLYTQEKQQFVIFDQYVNDGTPKTYLGDFKLDKEFKVNKTSTYMYKDPAVQNLTGSAIDEDFYNKYLEYDLVNKELFFGMSGHALDFKPGNVILFDSKYIHCTGKMSGNYKIGCSLRFTGNLV